MNLGKSLTTIATAPVRIGLAAADAGLGVATSALGLAHRTLGEASGANGSNAVAHMLGIDDAITRANRLARLLDDDAPLGRAVATDGPLDRLLRPGGVVDMLTAPGGLLDRLLRFAGWERPWPRDRIVDLPPQRPYRPAAPSRGEAAGHAWRDTAAGGPGRPL